MSPANHNRCIARRSVLALFICTLGIYAYAEGYVLVEGPHADDPLQTHIYRLDNGLEVYLSVNRETPRFFAEIAVRAGSKHDPPETTGLAHYMEHLLFKGSQRLGVLDYEKEKVHLDRIAELYEKHFEETDPEKRRAIYEDITRESTLAAAYAIPNEFDQLYRAMGGRGLNAHTWHEEVVYKIDLPINCLENWAIIESDRFANPVFRLFQTELETVYEEMNRALDNKNRIIQNAVNAQLFKNHPYGQQPTLGLVEHLKSPSIRRIHEFYDAWYVPNNMAIFISGDINLDETISTIARYFSGWQPAPLPDQKTWDESPLQGREEVRVQYRAEPFVLLAFRTVPGSHPDAEPLLMLDMILDNAVAGLINLNLNQAQRVRESGGFPLLLNDYGAQYLYGVPKDGQSLQEVEQLLLEQLQLIKEGAFEDWLIPAIINDYKKREKTTLESDDSRVSVMRQSWISFEPWERAFRAIERMESVTREDVIRVANTYFGDNYVAGLREDAPHEPPTVEKPPLPEIAIDAARQSEFARDILSRPLEPIEPVFLSGDKDFQHVKDDTGLVLFYTPNPLNDVFSMAIIVDYGTRQDDRMAIASRLLQRTGTTTMSPAELQIAWYKLGTDFNVSVEDNQLVISLTGLDEMLAPSLALLQDMLLNPVVDEDTLEELKRIILVQREDAKKDPETILSALVDYNRYGSESAWLKMLPSNAVKALGAVELQELLRTALSSRHYLLYSGTVPPEKLLDIYNAHRITDGMLAEPPPYIRPVMRSAEQTEVLFLDREMAQAHIRLEFDSVPYNPAMSPAVQLYNTYFAGSMSGIVFQELREVRALAYMVGARYRAGERQGDQNVMLGVIQTQADKTMEALTTFIDLMDNLPLSPERYALAREALLNDYRSTRSGFRSIPGILLDWERRGLEPDPRREWYEAVLAATDMSLLESFHKAYITGKNKQVSMVGETGRIALDSLQAIAPVRTITTADIFVD